MQSRPFTPVKQNIQRLMVYAYGNGGIAYKDQDIYPNSSRFYKAIKYMKQNGYIRPVCTVCKKKLNPKQKGICGKRLGQHRNANRLVTRYDLTVRGSVFVYTIKNNV